uniref:Large ribosomal subunit protein uL4c n=1 Tax=Nephromyces sp. ex Molgula occidentalis TaxID=2544991 RepID=A0A5C1HAA8_9APIC|nr:50S ribosomal protein L4 [Nephromyces sp. ex Molgula occidentalis]
MNKKHLLEKKILLFYPIRPFNNWTLFLKDIFILKGHVSLIDYLNNKKKLFIKDVIDKEYNFFIKQNTSSTKTRADINKSNKKPRPQKGLGKSRAGSFKSPLWKGGGIVFGPKPISLKKKISNKILKLSKYILLFNKRSNIFIIKYNDNFPILTNNLNSHISNEIINLGISLKSKWLIINTTFLSLNKYINNIKIINIFNLTALTLLNHDYIFIFI